MNPTCETCRFWCFPNDQRYGECRRYPPTVIYTGDIPTPHEASYGVSGKIRSRIPNTWDDFWCGEHQPKPKPVNQYSSEIER